MVVKITSLLTISILFCFLLVYFYFSSSYRYNLSYNIFSKNQEVIISNGKQIVLKEKIVWNIYTQRENLIRYPEPPKDWIIKSNSSRETLVPDIVHYVLFDFTNVTFIFYLSLKSVLINHTPEIIYIHTNCCPNNGTLQGKYWERINDEIANSSVQLIVRVIEKPKSIFGIPLSKENINWHAADVMRLEVLLQFGGIYLDMDNYVMKSLRPLLRYEMTLSKANDDYSSNGMIIAHKDSRFLHLWYYLYHYYEADQWSWNGAVLPTGLIIKYYPHLFHRINYEFGVYASDVCPYLYPNYEVLIKHKNAEEWMKKFSGYYNFHLFMRGHEVTKYCRRQFMPESQIKKDESLYSYNEESIKRLDSPFGEMARMVFYGVKEMI